MVDRSQGNQGVFEYEYDEETATVRINTLGSMYGASIEDYPEVMARVINILQEVPNAESVILAESREYEYGEDQVKLLREIATAIQEISRQGYVSQDVKTEKCDQLYSEHLPEVQKMVFNKLRMDPVGAYVQIKRKERHLRQKMEEGYPQQQRCCKYFIQDVISPVKDRLEECKLIQQAQDQITGHHVGEREIYREYFHPLVRPNFMLTKFMSLPPERGEEMERYEMTKIDAEVTIYDVPAKTRPVYHVDPPEFNLSEEKYNILDAARRFMASHDPQEGEFAEPDKMRDVFQNIGRDMLRDVANQMGVKLENDEMEQLANILNRYTSGLGVLEILLSDPKIQDVYINSPIGDSPIFISHQDHEECETNLIPTKEEAESWATRFRIQSGRPLDEANPVLDTETEVEGGRARVAVIQENLSPEGLAFAFRRHRSRAWTLPLFVHNGMLSALAAGLISFIVDGNRSVLFAGTRGAGKTSLLSASMLEIMKSHRIVTVEDTLELPVPQMKDLGYNIERMKSRSVITQVENEMGADEAIRTSLRLGDSALVIGEVRSEEAQALYEAMRVGAVANFVGGTIHGEDAYSVFDRVVNDLGVPRTSFKATDIVVQVNKIESPGGMETYRRVTGITEVRKEWEEDPQSENAFVDLMRYDSNKDKLVPTDTLINGESLILNRIAENIKEWKNDWDKVWNNIQLRKDVKQAIVDKYEETGDDELLEAEFDVRANQQFHLISEKVNQEYGEQDRERIFSRWEEWLDQQVDKVPHGRDNSDDGLNEREKERLKDVIDDINENVKRPPYNTSDNDGGYSREYKEFKEEEEESQELTQYEVICYRMASLFNLSADESTQEKLNPSIRLLDWEITPGMVMSATVGVGFFSFLAWFIVFMLNLLVLPIIPVSLLAIAVLAPVGATAYTYYYPIFAAQNKVIRSSGEMILSILYMVIYMRTSANLEGAIRFAALNLQGPISDDLKGVLWDVESGKYNRIDESLENYTKRWKEFNQDYLESLNLLRASLNEPNADRRDRLMQDAIDNILDGTKEKMKHYAQNLETPVMIINAVGAMLPVLGMIMLPLISAFMGGVITPLHLLIMFNIMLPTFLWIFMQRTLSSRPPTVSSKPSKKGDLPERGKFEFEIMDRELSVPTWPIGALIFLIVAFYGLIGYLLYPHFYPVENFNPAVVPGIFMDQGKLDPFTMLLRSVSITLGLGLGIGTSKILGNKARASAEEDIKEIEQQFPTALFELGNKISGGTPIELALEDAAKSTKDLKISNLFIEASNNIKNMGMTFRDAIFDENYGALHHYPSQTIETVMRAILSSSEKGTQMASTAMMTISRYLENIHDTQEQLNDLMEDTTTTIQMLAYMLAPVISGVAVSMSQTIITALYALGESFSSTTENLPNSGAGGIGGAGILQNLQSAIPPELLQFVVGFYLLQLLYILGTFYTKITQGEDETFRNLFIGKIMISGLFFYAMTVIIISLMFGGLVSSVGSNLG